MQISDNWIFIGFLVIVTRTCANAIVCASCEGENEEKCDKNQTYQICPSELNQCMNVSYTYIENHTKKHVFRRACLIMSVHWDNCDFACYVAKRYESKDCEPNCCSDDKCNTRQSGKVVTDRNHAGRTYGTPVVAFSLVLIYIIATSAIT